MSRNPRRTKGQKPRINKTDRKELSNGVRQAIVNTDGLTSSTEEAKKWDGVSDRLVRATRQRARKRAYRTINGSTKGKPLADITNVATAPRGRPSIKLTEAVKVRIVSAIIQNRRSRRLHLLVHQKQFKAKGIDISVDSIRQVMYEAGYSFSKTAMKPFLTDDHRDLRKTLCRYFLDSDPSKWVFIDAASIRLHDEGVDRCWQAKDKSERYSEDVMANKYKEFSEGMFFGAISLGYRQGPWHIFEEETPAEKEAAKKDLEWRTQPHMRSMALQFAADEARKDQVYEAKGQLRPGKRASFDVFLRKELPTRSERDKRDGVDWYRLCHGWFEPELFPWIRELKRLKGEDILLAMDNAAPHSSKHTTKFLLLNGITKLLWPAQSPDLNPIEAIWDYIRKQIRRRPQYPENKADMFIAWQEEWMKVPQRKIDAVIAAVVARAQKVLDNDGRNNFHG